MKLQSLLINSSAALSKEELNAFLKDNAALQDQANQLNILEITSEKNSIGIAELEEIAEWINLKSSHLKFVLINSAENLTPEAQNSLLKNLEEPPENTIFILITKNSDRILETIRSRCIQLYYKSDYSSAEEYADLAKKFLRADFLERSKMAEQITKDYESREQVAQIVFEVLKNLPHNNTYADKVKVIKNIYVGVKGNVNLKLSLDLLAIYLDDPAK